MHATISADSTVTFSEPTPTFAKGEVEAVLHAAQAQGFQLAELDREVGRSKEFMAKVRAVRPCPLRCPRDCERISHCNVSFSSSRHSRAARMTRCGAGLRRRMYIGRRRRVHGQRSRYTEVAAVEKSLYVHMSYVLFRNVSCISIPRVRLRRSRDAH